MRHQERIYTQTNVECLRNKTYQTPFCGGDIDSFTNPTYQISGHTASTCSYAVQTSYTGVNYAAILATAVSACTSATTCLSAATWSLNVSEDGDTVYSGSTGTTGGFWTGTTVTGGTPSDVALKKEIQIAFDTLGYSYSSTGMVFYITKPWATTTLQLDLCVAIDNSVGAFCSGNTCPPNCSLIGKTAFSETTSSSGGVYVIDDEAGVDEIDMYFVMNEPEVFTNDRHARFRYTMYKYNPSAKRFSKPIAYDNGWFDKSDLDGGNNFEETIPVADLRLDGDYLIKGYFEADVTTEYRSKLGDKIKTDNSVVTKPYATLNPNTDGYFISCYKASTPYFSLSNGGSDRLGALRVLSFSADGTTNVFTIGGDINGAVIVSLNGVTMANNLDYTITATTNNSGFTYTDLTFLAPIVSGDIISYAYVSTGASDRFRNDQISVTSPVTSGVTDGQGTNDVYFNTTTGKYELYTTLTPVSPNDLYVTINGVTLANNLDYYQSITNAKRVILEGDVLVGDIINLYYNSFAEVNGDVWFSDQPIYWNIARPPQALNGLFTVQISDTEAFTTITQSATTDYVVGGIDYSANITFSGTVGQTYYYRVRNEKNYRTMCGDVIASEAYSEIVPAIVRTNSINSY